MKINVEFIENEGLDINEKTLDFFANKFIEEKEEAQEENKLA